MKQFFIGLILLFPLAGWTQLRGRVVNERNEAVPFASVIVRNGASSTGTDSAGQFELPTPDKFPVTLQVSSVGYRTRDIQIRSASDRALLILLEAIYRQDTVVIITSRRRRETLQAVPIAISVIAGQQVDDAGAFNVTRVKEVIPSVQMYTSNPRNTGINIRGIGSPFGLTNDGLDPGVGFYVDGVYMARPAVATLDFLDVEQIEVLRGPQGTLFGKNTTSGAFNITTRKPSFLPGASFETSFGNYGFVQAKASVTGPLGRRLAARLSFAGTQRDGTIYNILQTTRVCSISCWSNFGKNAIVRCPTLPFHRSSLSVREKTHPPPH